MSMRKYLITCGVVTVVTVVSMLFVPGVSETFEGIVLLFLSTNAS